MFVRFFPRTDFSDLLAKQKDGRVTKVSSSEEGRQDWALLIADSGDRSTTPQSQAVLGSRINIVSCRQSCVLDTDGPLLI